MIVKNQLEHTIERYEMLKNISFAYFDDVTARLINTILLIVLLLSFNACGKYNLLNHFIKM